MKNSAVPPAICAPLSVLPLPVTVLPHSQMSPPTCLAWGSASRICNTFCNVIFLRAHTSGESGPNCTAGQRWS